MRRSWTIGIMCAALAGCSVPSPFQGMVPGIPSPPGDLAADRAVCNKEYPPRIGNYLPHTECVNAAIERDAIPLARYPDLIRLQEQLRVKYSAAIDRGALSPQVGERKMREADELVDETIRDRDRGRDQVAKHRLAALESLLQY